jgi:hypothetical protein
MYHYRIIGAPYREGTGLDPITRYVRELLQPVVGKPVDRQSRMVIQRTYDKLAANTWVADETISIRMPHCTVSYAGLYDDFKLAAGMILYINNVHGACQQTYGRGSKPTGISCNHMSAIRDALNKEPEYAHPLVLVTSVRKDVDPEIVSLVNSVLPKIDITLDADFPGR